MTYELNQIYNESCLETLKRFPDELLDCCITSPPYWQLRDYGYTGQWGLEPTYQEYLEHLWSLMDGLYKKLKSGGTVWINLGDTYGTQSGNMRNPVPSKESNHAGFGIAVKQPKSIHKCLLLLPHRFAIGCIERGWIVRNDIIWAKRNAIPESVTDRFSKKHEYFFFMVKSKDYYFDLDAIRDKLKNPVLIRNKASEIYGRGSGSKQFSEGSRIWGNEDKGKNPGSISDFWDIPNKPSSKAHYAKYNSELIKKPILAGCPEGGIIYDPFAGTNTTGFTALRANRNFIASEMGLEYYNASQKELEAYKAQKKLNLV